MIIFIPFHQFFKINYLNITESELNTDNYENASKTKFFFNYKNINPVYVINNENGIDSFKKTHLKLSEDELFLKKMTKNFVVRNSIKKKFENQKNIDFMTSTHKKNNISETQKSQLNKFRSLDAKRQKLFVKLIERNFLRSKIQKISKYFIGQNKTNLVGFQDFINKIEIDENKKNEENSFLNIDNSARNFLEINSKIGDSQLMIKDSYIGKTQDISISLQVTNLK